MHGLQSRSMRALYYTLMISFNECETLARTLASQTRTPIGITLGASAIISPLRQRMIDDMNQRRLMPGTQPIGKEKGYQYYFGRWWCT